MTRGKRRPQSRDDTPIGGMLESEWRIESKFGQQTPRLVYRAYHQAQANGAIGDLRPSAVIIGDGDEPALFIARLKDVIAWRDALVAVASGFQIKAHARNIQRALDGIDDILRGQS